ncbi:uncharacterized protein [Halyomorpha halys]|uniref:uncharacterized protein n=1 Tax=Halyomorpha halys TaxID=286706 RepID=UPI0006D50736|nr:uncharacterized protein LOC106680114 [Halyomorpha halys]XP_014275098.1 uncharacterized protein LOC106680114 [Halyomorpha halys]XP_014275099.1 uncharacterized protein LOC106680114 [Halyomorpha halys]
MDKEVLEVVLKKLAKESSVASIVDVEAVPALPKGENYSSTILRVSANVVLGNGRMAKKSFIMKQLVTEGKGGELMKEYNVARQETHVYTVILKQMSYLMEEFEDTDEPLWCNFVHYDPELSYILLEDLKASGYSCVPRQESLDLDHAILALRGLGRFHGMAKVLEQRGIISNDNKPNELFNDFKLIRCFPYAGILNVSKAIKSWGPDWEEASNKLKIPFEPFAEMWRSMGKAPTDTEFIVLNHGDCWSNNIMFKYDFQNRPIIVKFLDFQNPTYNTSCMDVTNLLYLGIKPTVRRSNYKILLETYHDSLVRSLDKFGFTGTKPTLKEITASMKRLEVIGLTNFTAFYAGLVGLSTEHVNIEKLLTTNGEEGFNEDVIREPGMIEKLGPDILDFVERYIPTFH